MDADAQLVTYRVVQEALSNVARHARGAHGPRGGPPPRRPRRRPLVRRRRGIDPQAPGGLGLAGMRERALLVGGTLSVMSTPASAPRSS
jgi:signal transduction histidine kinase